MSKKSLWKGIGKPPKIGMEIEANWPDYQSLPAELRTAFETVEVAGYGRGNGTTAYTAFRNCSGPIASHSAYSPDVRRFYEIAPKKYHYPEGWDKGHDSGVEMRFNGPVDSVPAAEALIKSGAQWLKDFGHDRFASAGTHVHLGSVAWLDEIFGPNVHGDPVRGRAETLLWGYFSTREAGIFACSAQHRVSCGSCPPTFYQKTSVSPYNSTTGNCDTATRFGAATPLWALHNHFITNPYPAKVHAALGGGACQSRRKNLPTLEFRHFTGTRNVPALIGYVRLLHSMFERATTLLTEEACRAKDNDTNGHVLANPFTYTVSDLKKETDDPWVLKWIDATVANRGEPIANDIEITDNRPQAIAAA